MTDDHVPPADEYRLRARLYRRVLSAFTADHPDAIRYMYEFIRGLADRGDPYAGEVQLHTTLLVHRWFDPYHVTQTAANRRSVIAEIQDELRLAEELAQL